MWECCVDLVNARFVPQLPFHPRVQITHSDSGHAISGVLHIQKWEKFYILTVTACAVEVLSMINLV